MQYLSVAEIAKKWNMSERSVRNYCAKGRVNGAFLTGKKMCIRDSCKTGGRKDTDRHSTQAFYR